MLGVASRSGLYAGWILVDVKLLAVLVLLSVGVALLLLALIVHRRAWHEYVSLFLTVATILFVVGLFILQVVVDYPVFVERHFFPID